jgi:glycosyltransferase involved in cell wall biosynthesis
VALRLDPTVQDPVAHHVVQVEKVRQLRDHFDVIHFHTDYLHFPVIREFADRTVTTMHGRLDLPDLVPLHRTFPEVPLVSISQDQRRPLETANWVGMVHHGLPLDLLPAQTKPGAYLAFLGRISPEKRPDRAIEIAARTGLPLKIAAKIGAADKAYWDEVIQPMVAAYPHVEFVGEINEAQKAAFLGDAAALLFPIDWPEPFGLVMIEAMACGTPVIAFRNGSVPEIVEDGRTGYIVETVDQAVEAVGRLPALDRRAIRAAFERRFSVKRMAKDYLAIYYNLVGVRLDAAHLRRIQHEDPALQIVA